MRPPTPKACRPWTPGRASRQAPPPPPGLRLGAEGRAPPPPGLRVGAGLLAPPPGLLGGLAAGRPVGREPEDGGRALGRDGDGREEDAPPEGRLGNTGRLRDPDDPLVLGRALPEGGRTIVVPPPGRFGGVWTEGLRWSVGRSPRDGFARSSVRGADGTTRLGVEPGFDGVEPRVDGVEPRVEGGSTEPCVDGRASPPRRGTAPGVEPPRGTTAPPLGIPVEGRPFRSSRSASLGTTRRRGGTNSRMGGAATAGSRYSAERRSGGCRVRVTGVHPSPAARSLNSKRTIPRGGWAKTTRVPR